MRPLRLRVPAPLANQLRACRQPLGVMAGDTICQVATEPKTEEKEHTPQTGKPVHGLRNDRQSREGRPQEGIDCGNPPYPVGDELIHPGHEADGGKQGKEKRGIEINAGQGRNHTKEQTEQTDPANYPSSCPESQNM